MIWIQEFCYISILVGSSYWLSGMLFNGICQMAALFVVAWQLLAYCIAGNCNFTFAQVRMYF